MIAVKEIKEKIAIKKEEMQKYNIEFGDRLVKWSDEGETYEIDIEFDNVLLTLIGESLQEKNRSNQLTGDMITIYQKFCLNTLEA